MLKLSPWLQITLAYAVLEVALWTEGRTQARVSLVAAAVIVALTFISARPADELGLHLRGLPGSLRSVVIGAFGATAIVLVGWAAGTLHPLYGHNSLPQHAVMYFVWATVQQFILQSFFYVQVESRYGNTWKTVLITAFLFAFAHIPNPVLAPATFLGALFFCEFFRRHRTIYPLAAAHALLGLAIAVAFPDSIIHHMRVGIAYLHYP